MAEPHHGETDHASVPNTTGAFRGWIIMFALFFVLFAATANRGAQWQDSGLHILRVVTGQSLNPLGLALSHPLHHWLGRLAVQLDLWEPCFAVTLLSVLAGALAVANVYGCVLSLTHRWLAALLAAGSLGFAQTFWQLATRAETYTLCAALLAGECWCLAAYAQRRQKKHLWIMLYLNGLGITNHLLALLTTPVLTFIVLYGWWKKEIRGHAVAVAAMLWAAGSLPYSGMVLTELIRNGDFLATAQSALFGRSFSDEVLNTAISSRILMVSIGFVGLSFPNLLLPAAVHGLIGGRRIRVPALARRALAAGLVIHAGFVFRYNIVDQHTFFLPLYVLLCIFGGVGFACVMQWRHRKPRQLAVAAAVVLIAATPLTYAAFPRLARQLDLLGSAARNRPYRDDYVYLFVPWSVVEHSAERMSRQAVAQAGDRGLIVVEDRMASFAIRYHALRSGHDELQIVLAPVSDQMQRAISIDQRVVLVPADADAPATVPPVGSWKRIGDLYLWTRPAQRRNHDVFEPTGG